MSVVPRKKRVETRGRPRKRPNAWALTIRYHRLTASGCKPTRKNILDVQAYANLLRMRGLGHKKRRDAYERAIMLKEFMLQQKEKLLAGKWFSQNSLKSQYTEEFKESSAEERVLMWKIIKQLEAKEPVSGWTLFPTKSVETALHVIVPVVGIRGEVTLCRELPRNN